MNTKSISFPGFSLDVPDGWDDITEELRLEEEDCPWTIADETSGVGSFQFSVAVFDGPPPGSTDDELFDLVCVFAEEQGLADGFDRAPIVGQAHGIAMSFRDDDDFYRIAYLTDGRTFLLVTYTSDWEDRQTDATTVQAALESLRFQSPTKRR